MHCKICGGPFTSYKFFRPSTLEPMLVDTSNCGRRLLAQENRQREKDPRKVKELPSRPIEVSVEV